MGESLEGNIWMSSCSENVWAQLAFLAEGHWGSSLDGSTMEETARKNGELRVLAPAQNAERNSLEAWKRLGLVGRLEHPAGVKKI